MNRTEFLNRLFEYCDNGQVQLRAIHITAGIKGAKMIDVGDWVKVDKFCKQNSRIENYFTVATRNGGGTKEHIKEIPALYCDLDFKNTPEKQAIKNVEDFPFEPSIVVRSGGGFQLYWLLKEPAGKDEIPQVEDAITRITSYLGGDMGALDASRVLRLPGTKNHKYPHNPIVEITKVTKKEYTYQSILELLPIKDISKSIENTDDFCRPMTTVVDYDFRKGNRDNALFHLANQLFKVNEPPENIEMLLKFIARHCDFPEKEVLTKIKSASQRTNRKNRNLTQEIREWVLSTSGEFLSTDVTNCLLLSTRQDRQLLSKVLRLMVKENVIERVRGQNARFRKIEADCPEIDWMSVDPKPMDLEWPFEIEQYVNIYPGNIIVLAGEQNAGKTALLLNFALMNQYKKTVHFFSSEMGPEEMKIRAELFGETVEWKMKFYERSSEFEDVIKPNDINIIDFVEIHDNFYEIGGILKRIYDKLNQGIAIIAIQKPPGRDIGKGGYSTLEKPRLYLSLSNEYPGHRLKIVKAKNYANQEINPNGLSMYFLLYGGCKLSGGHDWERKQLPRHKPQPLTL